jgi:hypothetical protein
VIGLVRPAPALAGLAAAAWLAAAGSARADVSVILQDGRATVILHDATPRQALAEWARVGQTRIQNLDRVPGGPVTIELRDVPEARALEVLLRSVAGYIAAPRPAGAPGASVFDRILILPTSVASAAPPPMRAAAPMPVFQPPDPTALANDEPQAPNASDPGSVFPQPAIQPSIEGNPPAVQPYTPPTSAPTTVAPQAPPTLPTPGQYTTTQPGVIPVPAQPPAQPPQR